MITAYLTCFKGRLTAESTIVVDGTEWPVPNNTLLTETERIRLALDASGHRPAHPNLLDCMSDIDDAGGYTIELADIKPEEAL